jgi:hypothetical protein
VLSYYLFLWIVPEFSLVFRLIFNRNFKRWRWTIWWMSFFQKRVVCYKFDIYDLLLSVDRYHC